MLLETKEIRHNPVLLDYQCPIAVLRPPHRQHSFLAVQPTQEAIPAQTDNVDY